MKVLCFGSLNIDYVYSVQQFVRKGETISSEALEVFAGGKGLNQSIALSKAGARVCHAGVIGTDGMFLRDLLESEGVNTDFVKVKEDVRTGNAIIQRDRNGENCIILYNGSNYAVDQSMIDEVLERFEAGDYLLVQNEINEVPQIVEKAHAKGMKVILNPSPFNEKIFQIPLEQVDGFLLNEVEAQRMLGVEREADITVERLREKYPDAEFVLTLGAKGSVYLGKYGKIEQKAYKVKTVDTTAAGDTFTGYYLAGCMNGIPVKEALDLAARASAIAVSKKGASHSIPLKEEVLHFGK